MKATIAIDAGHGGSSSGTYSVNTVSDGLFEKDFTLEQALLVEKHLLKNGFKTILTRRTDINPGNVSQRAKIAVDNGADFALSIHFNGFGTESANGTEVFVPHSEKLAGIESGFYETLGEFFKRRAPFARSNSYFDRNKTFDKKINIETRRFDAVSEEKDYFGFVVDSWDFYHIGKTSADNQLSVIHTRGVFRKYSLPGCINASAEYSPLSAVSVSR